MEGAVGQIILFAILIIGAIAQQAIKKANRKASEVPVETQPLDEQEFLSTERPRTVKISDPYDFGQEINDHLTFENELASEIRLDSGISKLNMFKDPIDIGEISSDILIPMDLQPEEKPNSIISDFDLKKAVLYSEILKPKF